MRDPYVYVSGLLDLDKAEDPAQRRAIWRQSMATLARAPSDGPGPLEGIQPEALLRGVRPALASGLIEDLDWLAPAAAAGALYELASALPVGPEQRDLGRRVLARLLEANAEAFTQIATRMARSSGKGLSSAQVRARIALVIELPISLQVPDGALALALVSKRELAREWIVVPSTRSLPSRRLAARLFERAAREAARRATQGETHATRPFAQDALVTPWQRLLGDRESLVWRHIAVARGLLAPWAPDLRRIVEMSLAPNLSPTEWRRGAASASALAAVNADLALRLCTGAQANAVLERDPGAAAAFVWGVARAAEAEPDAAAEILEHVTGRAPLEVAEAILEVRAEFGGSPMIDRAAGVVLAALARAPSPKADDGAEALRREMARDLELAPRDDAPLRDQLAAALLKFYGEGARAAYAVSRQVLEAAKGELDALDAIAVDEDEADGRAGTLARRTSLRVLRDLDMSLLERNLLGDLLRLGEKDDARAHDEAVDAMRERLSEWILLRESASFAPPSSPRGVPAHPTHPTLRLRRLRALLHLVDGDVGDAQEDATRTARLRRRWLRVAGALLHRFERDPPSVLRRTIVAALARALDALVRVGACDVADVLLVVARRVTDPAEFETLAEASMDPDLIHVLSRYAAFLRASTTPIEIVAADDLPPESLAMSVADPRAVKLRAFAELASELAPDASGRIESLRAVLDRLHAAVVAVSGATSLSALSTDGSDPDVLVSLESWLGSLTQLANGAIARLTQERASVPPASNALPRPLSVAVARVLSGADAQLEGESLRESVDDLLRGVPAGIARVVSGVIWALADLPAQRKEDEGIELQVVKRLPDWIPPRRTLGGFFVLRGLGSGNVGSVFVVTRYEDRHDADAEKFALKVPEYSATAARSLSEAQFLDLFRSEASALLGVPGHPNLARFVTFDAGARPKPILVMELVKGVSLDKIVRSRSLDMARCLRLLDDVLAGLEAMHGVGVGHLDLKPSNVVIRDGDEAVLVDFGLAGRHVRPGCGTGPYGAPEVWGAVPDGVTPSPTAADIYAFGCLAFEALTGRVLFDAGSEVAQIAQHVAHDGMPPGLAELGADKALKPLVELLRRTLRRDARQRPSAREVRAALRGMAPALAGVAWPGSKS